MTIVIANTPEKKLETGKKTTNVILATTIARFGHNSICFLARELNKIAITNSYCGFGRARVSEVRRWARFDDSGRELKLAHDSIQDTRGK